MPRNILRVESTEETLPTVKLIFDGYSAVRRGDHIVARLPASPKYAKDAPNKMWKQKHDRAYLNEEIALELMIRDGESVVRRELSVYSTPWNSARINDSGSSLACSLRGSSAPCCP